MILKEFEYIQKCDGKERWKIKNLNLGKNNLLVGENSSGKTRTLGFIILLADILKGTYPPTGAMECKAVFQNDNGEWSYFLKKDSFERVIEEVLMKDKKKLIFRKNNKNEIYSEKLGKMTSFNPPENKLTVEVRRNEEEYPYLEKLIEWSDNLYAFSFSGLPLYQQLKVPGYNIFFQSLDKVIDILEKDSQKKSLKRTVLEDLNSMGYEIEDYAFLYGDVMSLTKMQGFAIKEKGIDRSFSKNLISAGMYRAFSIVVIFNHYLLLNKPCTIMIDDLGEGLDFNRSSKLTKLLFNKIKDTDIQLIVTSNDRFLMNAVDLEYWNVLDRKGHVVTSYNYEKNKEIFEEYSFIGLNNFDFFATGFYKEKLDD